MELLKIDQLYKTKMAWHRVKSTEVINPTELKNDVVLKQVYEQRQKNDDNWDVMFALLQRYKEDHTDWNVSMLVNVIFECDFQSNTFSPIRVMYLRVTRHHVDLN
jgi:hypothetical protein